MTYEERQLILLGRLAKEALDQWYEAIPRAGSIDLIVAGERLAGVVSRLQTLGELTETRTGEKHGTSTV